MTTRHILVIDDEASLRHMLSILLKKEGYQVTTVAGAEEGLEASQSGSFDIALCDVRMKGMDGFEFLRRLQDLPSAPTVVMMSAYGSMETAIQCMKLGAYDYISKPFNNDEIVLTLRKIEERTALLQENRRLHQVVSDGQFSGGGLTPRSEQMRKVLETAAKVAVYRTTILITGESGTGKEVLARTLHAQSTRADKPFVAVNCGAIPEELLESELFGHMRGAFTGAVQDKRGLFQEADSGTLFLDEIAELPVNLQVKLLRVLQENEVRRVGSNRQEAIDVRVVAATNQNIETAVKEGRFREDLYYRLNVVNLHIPPLRERQEDIAAFSELFLARHGKKTGKTIRGVSPAAMRILESYRWPGNVRELENCMERAVVLAEGEQITPEDLPENLLPHALQEPWLDRNELSIKKATEAIEKTLILRALEKTGGNRTHAAKLLELSHRALLYKIKSYGIAELERRKAAASDGQLEQV